jgi:hypothetical protein
VWIVDEVVPPLLVDIFVLPMALWVGRGPDATRAARTERLGTSATTVPSARGGGPQPLPSANHNSLGAGGLAGEVRPNRHGSSGSAR